MVRGLVDPRACAGFIFFLAMVPFMVLSANAGEFRNTKTISQSGYLSIGVDIPYGVMEFYDKDGRPAGIDIDIAKEMADALGVEARFEAMPFDSLFSALDGNEVDLLLSAVTITPERQQRMRFSAPYLSASTVVAVSKDNTAVASIEDLDGGTIGVLKGTLGEKLVQESDILKGLTARIYTDNDKRLEDLEKGVIDSAVVHFLVRTDLPVRILGDPLLQNYYGIVANIGNADLMRVVDRRLREMKRDGRLADIIKHHIEK